MSDEFDLHQLLGTHIPGDYVYIDEFVFSHEMHIDSVRAVFEHQDLPDRNIILSGRPEKAQDSRNEEGGRTIFYSRVLIDAEIPPETPPGLYKCRMVEALTVTGNIVAFEDPSNEEIDWDLWVLAEPSTSPKFGFR